jgi:hypothetical protein
MTRSKNWLKFLKKDPVPMLLKKASLPIRYAAARYFLAPESKQLESLKYEMRVFKPLEQLVKNQQDDGSWKIEKKYKIEERNRAMSFLLQLKNMSQLRDYGCTKELSTVQRGIIALLKTQKPDGKFPLLLHHHGYALWLLAKYGMIGNPFVEKGYRWLAKRQRDDGGWLSPSMLPAGMSVKTAKSGIWTTLFVFQAFSVHSRLRSSGVGLKAAKFVLENYLEQNHTTLFPEKDAWNLLYTDYSDNGMFRGGTLRFVEALVPLAEFHSHPNFKKALNWLLDQQLDSGLFPAIAGKSKDGDFAVTLRVVMALKELSRSVI